MKKVLLLIPLFILITFTAAASEFRSVEKATVVGIISKILPSQNERELLYKESLSIEITSGKSRGKREIIINPVYKNSDLNISIKKNDKIIVEEINSEGIFSYKILKLDQTAKLSVISILFLILIVLIFELKGLAVQIVTAIGAALLIYIYLPLICRGINVLFLTVMFLLIMVTLYSFTIFRNSFQRKFILILFAVSQVFSIVIWGIFGWLFRFNGYITGESHYLSSFLDKVDIKGFVPAGNLAIAALASVMAASFILHRIKPVMLKNSNEYKKVSLLTIREGTNFYKIFSILLFILYLGVAYYELTIYYVQNRYTTFLELINGDYIIFIILRYISNVAAASVIVAAAALYIGYYSKQNKR